MTVAIMQPTYMPWLGYFDLIDQSDIFVFLDTVQFERQSWQQRNRIKVGSGLQWLTVPVLRTGRSTQTIDKVQIVRSSLFPHKHICSIQQSYSRAPYYDRYFPQLAAILEGADASLSRLNQAVIRWLAATLGLKPDFKTSAELAATGKRSGLLVDICLELGAATYLSPIGSASYLLAEHGLFEKHGITVTFHNYQHPEYRQVSKPFLPYASVIDLLFNEGEHALAVIRSGRRPGLSVGEIEKHVSSQKQGGEV